MRIKQTVSRDGQKWRRPSQGGLFFKPSYINNIIPHAIFGMITYYIPRRWMIFGRINNIWSQGHSLRGAEGGSRRFPFFADVD